LCQKNEVLILNRGEELACLPLLWERAKTSPNIAYYARTRVERLMPRPEGGLDLKCCCPDGSLDLPADYMLIAIGRLPQTDFMSESLQRVAPDLEARGLLYWVGDVKNGIYRQTAIAVGDGILAAMKIYHSLKEAER
jgi:thioredoxin reductase